MAASAWAFYHKFKLELGKGNVDLTGTNTEFRMFLAGSTTNVNDETLESRGSTSGVITAGISTSGDRGTDTTPSVTVNWSTKATASIMSWIFGTATFTATSDTAITGVKYAVIATVTSSILVCYSQLSTAAFDVSAGNELRIYPNTVTFELE